MLTLQHVHKSFGGLHATQNVSLSVNQGEIVSIIGPNGAGKTTLFHQISGYLRPDSGDILFENQTIVGLSPQRIVRLGIGRSFQRSNIFPRLTTVENVQTAVQNYQKMGWHWWQGHTSETQVAQRVMHILEQIGLAQYAHQLGGKLALGDQKRLEIGLVLALEPQLMLLDEPTAGMSPEETQTIVDLIARLARDLNISLLFTEHDMAVVFGISQRIYVLHQGAIIAEGTPQAIADNAEVQRVYLGTQRV
jgi:branched-chain amino acid transport system ATP-binding protein